MMQAWFWITFVICVEMGLISGLLFYIALHFPTWNDTFNFIKARLDVLVAIRKDEEKNNGR